MSRLQTLGGTGGRTHTSHRQQLDSDARFSHGSRGRVTSTDPLVQFLVRWRLKEAFARLMDHCDGTVTHDSPILVLCAGEVAGRIFGKE